MAIETWMIAALLAALISAGEKVAHKTNMLKGFSVIDYTLAFQFLCVFITLPLVFSTRREVGNINELAFLYIFLAGVFWALFSVLTFKSDKVLEVSVKSGISRVRLIWIGIIGWLLFNDGYSYIKLGGMALILLSPMILLKIRGGINFKGVMYELGATLMISLALTFDKLSCVYLSESIVLLFSYLTSAALIIFIRKWSFNISLPMLKCAFLSAALSVSCYFLLLWSMSHGEISSVVSIYMMSPVFVTLAGIVFLKEKNSIRLKLVSVLIGCIGGIMTLG